MITFSFLFPFYSASRLVWTLGCMRYRDTVAMCFLPSCWACFLSCLYIQWEIQSQSKQFNIYLHKHKMVEKLYKFTLLLVLHTTFFYTVVSSFRRNCHNQNLGFQLKVCSQYTISLVWVHATILLPLNSVTLNVPTQAPMIYNLLEALKGFLLLSQVQPSVSSWKNRLSQASSALTWLRPQHMSPCAAMRPCAEAVMDLAQLGECWRDKAGERTIERMILIRFKAYVLCCHRWGVTRHWAVA